MIDWRLSDEWAFYIDVTHSKTAEFYIDKSKRPSMYRFRFWRADKPEKSTVIRIGLVENEWGDRVPPTLTRVRNNYDIYTANSLLKLDFVDMILALGFTPHGVKRSFPEKEVMRTSLFPGG